MSLRLSWVISWASARALVTPQWDWSRQAPLLSAEGRHRPCLGGGGAAVHSH